MSNIDRNKQAEFLTSRLEILKAIHLANKQFIFSDDFAEFPEVTQDLIMSSYERMSVTINIMQRAIKSLTKEQ